MDARNVSEVHELYKEIWWMRVSIERGEVLQAVSMLQMQGKIQALLAPRGICATGGRLLLHKHNTVAKTYCQVHTLCCIIA